MTRAGGKKVRVVRVVRVSKPPVRETPYRMHQRVAFWHPQHGQYQGKIVEVNEDKDTYIVELRSGSTMGVEGIWIKTRRPENGN